MKRIMAVCLAGLLCPIMAVKAQWVTFDPSNFAQSIVNTTRNVVQTTTTAENMVKNFQETVKIYEQGKRYYDALKAVNNLVKDARKVQQTVLLVGEISDIYVNSFQKMLTDENYTPDELSAIASGYAKMLEESSGMLNEMKTVVTSTSLSMTDKERMDVIDRVYRDVKKPTQSGQVLHEPEHRHLLPACKKEERYPKGAGLVRNGQSKILVT